MAYKAIQSPCSTSVLTEKGKCMRPALHPSMGETVLCARVARHLANYSRRELGDYLLSPGTWARRAAATLPLDYPGFLRFALHSLAVYLDCGMSSTVWLSNVLEASHFGHSFRRCYFFDYKENRSPYPRVTNRGVQTWSSPNSFNPYDVRLND